MNPVTFPADEYDRTPLHYATTFSDTFVLDNILGYRFYNINHTDCLHQTALHKAMHLITTTPEERKRKHYIVFQLLSNGANPNIRHPSDLSPLMIAADQEDVLLADILLQAGADPNARLETDGLFFKAGDSALSILARKEVQEEDDFLLPSLDLYETITTTILILQKLIHHKSTTPNTIFHALQKAKSSMRKCMRRIITDTA